MLIYTLINEIVLKYVKFFLFCNAPNQFNYIGIICSSKEFLLEILLSNCLCQVLLTIFSLFFLSSSVPFFFFFPLMELAQSHATVYNLYFSRILLTLSCISRFLHFPFHSFMLFPFLSWLSFCLFDWCFLSINFWYFYLFSDFSIFWLLCPVLIFFLVLPSAFVYFVFFPNFLNWMFEPFHPYCLI